MPILLDNTAVIQQAACQPIPTPVVNFTAPNIVGAELAPVLAAARVIPGLSVSAFAAPSVIGSVSGSAFVEARTLSSIGAVAMAAPVVISPASAALMAAPNNIGGISSSVFAVARVLTNATDTPMAAPNVVTPKAYSDMPPFPLSHPRILYENKLAGSSSVQSGVSNRENTLNPATYSRATFNGNGSSASITYTMPASQNVDCIAIAAHNLSDVGASVTVQWSAGPSGGLSFFAPAQTPTADNNALMFFRETPVNARRVHIRVDAPQGAGFIGVVYAGLALQMQRPIYGGVNPITLNRVTDYFNNRSESGEWLGRQIRRRGLESSLSFERLTAPWYRQYFVPFVRVARERPFFFAWRPSDFPDECAYCWTDSDIQPSNSGGGTDHLAVSFNVKAHS